MKDVPIKFCARRIGDDKTVFGYYVPFSAETVGTSECFGGFTHYIEHKGGNGIIDSWGKIHRVYYSTLRQLIGYDAGGNEVYEGDNLSDFKCSDTVIARLSSNVDLKRYCVININDFNIQLPISKLEENEE